MTSNIVTWASSCGRWFIVFRGELAFWCDTLDGTCFSVAIAQLDRWLSTWKLEGRFK